uniref:Membrane spanning 4-domains A8 n=1 Tax=Pseudonaja textilis TaxID=8673 RepID=A0A670ZHM8_PSETE
LAVATLPASMASGTVFVIPSNGANIIQMAPGLPSVALQASGTTPYPQYGAQQLGISTSAPQQVPQGSPLERFLKAEPKAVQIMIGLVHIGFGAVSHWLFIYYFTLSGIGGYPFWGGIFVSMCTFLLSHVKSSVGMNITSAIMAFIGIILYMCQLIITAPLYNTADTIRNTSYGFSSVLLVFSMLEFCIAVSLAHFGCQATCCRDYQVNS